MANAHYIKRHLSLNGQTIHQDQIIRPSGCIVILAEPGAGKTELLNNLAESLNTERFRANIFRNKSNITARNTLIIDGLDEVAKIDNSAFDSILTKASGLTPQLIIFASRASEWDGDRFHGLIKDYLGCEATTYYLLPFDESEQRAYFHATAPAENFNNFYTQVQGVDLVPLLGNPIFLKLFSLAYVEADRTFESKQRVFKDAITHLAKEHNSEIPTKNRPPHETLVEYAEEIFTKLLLSGSEGFTSIESAANSQFPFLYRLSNIDAVKLRYVMDTNLFKLADSPSLHEPIHRVVAEYCAASYLAKRIKNQQTSFSLRRCLAVIAPKGVVRHELRGLIGWLAALGDKDAQETIIDLDPYAVIANGDPSLLSAASKNRLLLGLVELAKTDPYFRLSDQWRNFSVKGFFSPDVIDTTTHIVEDTNNQNHLRGLILELLENSSQALAFEKSLTPLVISTNQSDHIRTLALQCLTKTSALVDFSKIFQLLADKDDQTSLRLSSSLVEKFGAGYFGREIVSRLLQKLAEFYPTNPDHREREIGKRYFIKNLIASLEVEDAEWFLQRLSQQVHCTCGITRYHECTCRLGISKIIGTLLDKYFELKEGHANPEEIWLWTKNLIFKHTLSKSRSIEALKANTKLRQSIQIVALSNAADPDELWKLSRHLYGWMAHAGLSFRENDIENIIRFAYESNNITLWINFYQCHSPYSKEKISDTLRALMRSQARSNSKFMEKLAIRDRQERESLKETKRDNYRFTGKYKAQSKKRRKDLADHFIANRELIRSGKDWWWLRYIAGYFFFRDQQQFEFIPDAVSVEAALCNCITFLEPNIPSLQRLSQLRCNNQKMELEIVVCAAAVAIFRRDKSLTSLNPAALPILKLELNHYSSSIDEIEFNDMDNEVNQRLFPTEKNKEQFLRDYFEPQLIRSSSQHVSVEWLRSRPEFLSFKKSLPLEWLNRFPDMPFQSLEILFAYCAAEHENRESLIQLIIDRCNTAHVLPYGPPTELQLFQRKFWYVRNFYFIEECSDYIWEYLTEDINSLFLFETYSGRWSRDESEGWPQLSAFKIYKILDAFSKHWPAVDLPSSWGSESPRSERAYRFLSVLITKIGDDDPRRSLPVLDQLIAEERFSAFKNDALHIKAQTIKKTALRDFIAPSPNEIIRFLDNSYVASVEDLRELLLEKLNNLQVWLKGTETDPLTTYYIDDKHVDENTARNRIVEFLQPRCSSLDVTIDIERNMASSNRCDITAAVTLDGQQHLLVIEVKGQWHEELFEAANKQLFERYSIHPNAAEQGIYLVLWFGSDQKVAGKVNHGIEMPMQLQQDILTRLPTELHGKIDIVVLDLSLSKPIKNPPKKRKLSAKKQ